MQPTQDHAADIYTLNAIATIVRREGLHDYLRRADTATETETASLCGVTVLWDRDPARITIKARDLEVAFVNGSLLDYARGTSAILQYWHRVLADLDNVFMRRSAPQSV